MSKSPIIQNLKAPMETDPLRSVHTSNLPALFEQLGISLVVSTYQAGKAIVVRNDNGALNTHFRTFAKPMGIAADNHRLTIGGANTVWDYRNMPAVAQKLEPAGKHDACYLPRRIHVTGDIDIHELAWDADNELWAVNTRFCCLCTFDADHSFSPRWRPPFVSALAPEDRCHLNGIAMIDGRPKYVTALGETDTPGGWRASKARGGILMDVESNEILIRGLSMPHSPRWYREKLWVLESGEGSLATVDLDQRTWQTVAQVPGFTRGIDFIGPLAFIGLSQVRESAVFSGIPLVQRLKERTCGVWVVNIETGKTIGFLRFESGVQEIFAVQILRGIRFPELLEWNDQRLAHSYVLPDNALADVVLPTEEELARSPAFHFQRGNEFYKQGKLGEAIEAFRQCVALDPAFPNARFHLGVALGDAEHFEEAGACLEQVVQAEPEKAEAFNSLGYVSSRQRQVQKAIEQWERAIQLQPKYAQAHVNLGMGLLQLGDYQRGFAEYEWRSLNGFRSPHPKWDGSPIPDKTLLIYTEQGAGDAIQFARYLPLAAERCKSLIVACPTDLMPIFATIPGIAQIREQEKIAVAEFDTYLPLMSLAHVFGTTFDTVPATVPYIDAAALRRRKDNPALSLSESVNLRIGIVWAGSPTNRTDRHRSCSLNEFLPILTIPEINFYSLQKGERHKDLADLPSNVCVQDMEPRLGDYGDLAVIIDQLDLVITVDTSVAHMAGALGKPVWTLLSSVPDWRWMLEGESTPWYPTMRLFRQTRAGDWTGVIELVAEALNRADWDKSEYSPRRRGGRGEDPEPLMNYLDLYSSYPDRTIVAAWDSQIKEANKAPWIAETLNHLDRELFSHFAVYYAQLCALPRGARRSLQRKLARSSELAAVLPTYLQQSGRRFQHRMAWSLAGAALLLALGQGAAVAATINVTTSNPNIVADGQCSLIEAIINANNDAATHADCAAGSGADTIVLPPNANVTLTNAYSNTFGATGLPPIASSITIQGNGTMIARQGNAPEFRIITIASLGNLKLQQMTLTGGLASSGGGIRNDGTLTIENTTISGNTTGITGGGVLNSGTLSINNSILSGNVAQYGGAGLINYGTLTIENSTISSNVASYPGGGIRNFGNLTIGNSTISGNTGYFSGGGVVNYGAGILVIENSIISGNIIAGPYFNSGGGVSNFGSLTLQNSTISINTAERGGGLLNSGKLSVKSSSISGNTAVNGGGLTNYGSLTIENSVIFGNTANKGGGGVYSFGNLTITNSTISGNTANVGGGLRNTAHCYFGCSSASLTVENSTISGNHANQGGGVSNALVCYYGCPPTPTPATLTFNRSLIAGNEASVAPEIDNQSTNIVNANNFNLFGTSGNAGVSGFAPGSTDIVPSVSLAQILGPLANNGGPTLTHALVPASPAIDAGDPGGCRDSQGKLLVTEQRGFARHADGNNDGTIRCDIGAFEFGAEFVPIPPGPLALGATTLPTGEIGAAFSSDLMISGGVGSYGVSIIKGKLPAGLSVGNDGVISGTPSTNARSERVSVRITDSVTGESITQTFTITVLKALHIAGKLKVGRAGKDYTDSLKARGGLGPFNWNITSGAVPGLSFNNSTGVLTGIPTQAGEFPLTVQVSDALGGIDSENVTLKIR